ncbi:hypothetical protein AVEN_97466-1 [Araneus ventricosus]|uniref:Uncharacterized protein n=1 Tax=Araneus ventricosus TaxID=182803 RepID=A0A4Y2S9G7_ARAVE|nr:hypothetical protein AVEN_97466-1 [Araneus ventricosus]
MLSSPSLMISFPVTHSLPPPPVTLRSKRKSISRLQTMSETLQIAQSTCEKGGSSPRQGRQVPFSEMPSIFRNRPTARSMLGCVSVTMATLPLPSTCISFAFRAFLEPFEVPPPPPSNCFRFRGFVSQMPRQTERRLPGNNCIFYGADAFAAPSQLTHLISKRLSPKVVGGFPVWLNMSARHRRQNCCA